MQSISWNPWFLSTSTNTNTTRSIHTTHFPDYYGLQPPFSAPLRSSHSPRTERRLKPSSILATSSLPKAATSEFQSRKGRSVLREKLAIVCGFGVLVKVMLRLHDFFSWSLKENETFWISNILKKWLCFSDTENLRRLLINCGLNYPAAETQKRRPFQSKRLPLHSQTVV